MLHPSIRKFLPALALAVLACGCDPQRSTQSDPKKAPNYLRAQTLVSQMDYVGAIDEFKRALRDNQDSAPAHLELGFLFKDYADDPASAIYHFTHYLELAPDTDQSTLIHQNMDNCKMQLAKLFLIAPVIPSIKKELDQLKGEVKTLKQQNYKLRWQLSALNAPENPGDTSSEGFYRISHPIVQAFNTPAIHNATRIEPALATQLQMAQATIKSITSTSSLKLHTIRNGEYPAKIARRYGIKVEALLKANPGINPRRLQIGDKVTIPVSSS